MKSILYNIRIAPKKLNLIATMIRGKSANEALDLLKHLPKKAAPILWKALHSAIKNAENGKNKKTENLVIEKVYVGKGITLHRSMPVSRGRAHPIRKRCSHLKIYLVDTAVRDFQKSP